ncbi:FAD-dependent oxidoreductase [Octadecabacter sp. SW4]|uniref:NAD(P)/FAD-dependent oxidoreductase n=1 Tax=Octadecabacter sp. SW4 TaxID=2602067 RepID=UPI0011C1DB3D|nr:FAD-dependent oxidoreductase [Octadecabacter sp. SW4]QEE34372.1 FAD-dependent oxidoreductase [Octadecabacter sp. SW4]
MATVDVTVRGAGAFGLAVGFACARRGAAVRVIDPHGAAAGASGGIVGALAPHVPENWNDKKAFQFDSLMMADAFWQEVSDIAGKDVGYARLGRLQPLADDSAVALARQRSETARDLWQGRAIWEVIDAPDTPWTPQSATGLLIHDTLTARIHPRRATHALAAAITALGGEVTTSGTDEGAVVWATGWQGLAALTAQRSRLVGNGIKGQAALMQFDARDRPQLFADALHIVPHNDGTVAIGSTSEREFDDPTSTDSQLDDIIARAIKAFPVLDNAPVIERWAGVRPRARSRAPMIGGHPFRAGEFIANGGFKIGFGMAPKVGAVMADLILDGHDTIPKGFRAQASL